MEIVDKFLMDVKRNHFKGTKDLSPSMHIAVGSVRASREILSKMRHDATVRDVLGTLRKYGKELAMAGRYGFLIANVVRRLLWIVRDEYAKFLINPIQQDETIPLTRQDSARPTDSPFLRPIPETDSPVANPDSAGRLELAPFELPGSRDPGAAKAIKWNQIKTVVLKSISEYVDEFDNIQTALCTQAEQHVRDGEVILTFGHSSTIEAFLTAAAERRKFKVYVAQSAPSTAGVTMARNLKAHNIKNNIDVQVISDATIFAIMSDVGKVIVGTQYVLANGGLITEAGIQVVALAAKHYNVPVLVIAAAEKFCPYFPADRHCSAVVKLLDVGDHPWTNEGDPHLVAPYAVACRAGVHVVNAVTDYVDPDLVTLFITNGDSFASSYVYRLISESYNPEDADI